MNKEQFMGNEIEIIDILGKKYSCECMGCDIVNGVIDPPGGIIYDGKYAMLTIDPIVPIPGFLVINFKRHVNSFFELNSEERHEVSELIYFALKSLKDLNIVTNLTIIQEECSKHFHVWIFPNYDWMKESFGEGVTYVRDIMNYACSNISEEIVHEVICVADKIKRYFLDNKIQ